jgi:6,7-dimethyl-8-ribityllumazine synthase
MAESNYKSFSTKDHPIKDLSELSIGVVRTEWNSEIIDLMASNCKKTLVETGIDIKNIHCATVPGAFELPMGAKLLLSSISKPDAIICLGCVIKGETPHDQYISQAVSTAIAQLNLVSGVPVIFGVLTPNTREQGMARADGSHGDKGHEAAIAALKMISLKEQLASQGKKISFH